VYSDVNIGHRLICADTLSANGPKPFPAAIENHECRARLEAQ